MHDHVTPPHPAGAPQALTPDYVIAVKNDVCELWFVSAECLDPPAENPETTDNQDHATRFNKEDAERLIFDLMHRWPNEKFRIESLELKHILHESKSMSETDFIEKWKADLDPYWASDASRVYWARSYKMELATLREMSEDFIKASPMDNSSSMVVAKETLSQFLESMAVGSSSPTHSNSSQHPG